MRVLVGDVHEPFWKAYYWLRKNDVAPNMCRLFKLHFNIELTYTQNFPWTDEYMTFESEEQYFLWLMRWS